jgi:ABC-2 type transport system ATP-binding protein
MSLSAVDIVKEFDGKKAVDGLSIEVKNGEFIALLGPNGAGKTTTVNMLTGLLKPEKGRIYYDNKAFNGKNTDIKAKIGVVPQHNNVDRDLTIEQNLMVHCKLFGIKDSKTAIESALEFSGLSDHRKKAAGKLSGGMKRRLVIARAMLHSPKILFLDEPTTGLDASVRRTMWNFIRSINKKHGCTVILTTHYIEEAEVLADRVVIMDKGKIAAEGETEELKERVGRFAIDIYKEEDIETRHFSDRDTAVACLEKINEEARIREVSLEDVYLSITGRRIDV